LGRREKFHTIPNHVQTDEESRRKMNKRKGGKNRNNRPRFTGTALEKDKGTCKHKKLRTHNGETEEGGDGAAENSSERGRRVSKGHEVNM
jgi:hypothetical protein